MPNADDSVASKVAHVLDPLGAVELENQAEAVPAPAMAHAHNSIFQKPWVQEVLPFATSFAFHASIILVALLIAKPIKQVVEVVREQIIIPEATLAENGPPGGLQHPGLGGDPTRDAAQDLEKNVSRDAEGWSSKASLELNKAAMGGGAGETESTPLIAVGKNIASGAGKGNGSGAGNDIGGGNGDGGLARWGVPGGGGGAGPKSSFVGVGGNARKIVYLCDESGTMLSVFSNLKFELTKSIEALRPPQSFGVVFFRDDKVEALDDKSLLLANPENKRKAFGYVNDRYPAGLTNPIPAINLALSLKPELMYVLTDGFDNVSNFDDVINAFRKGNPDKKIHVNCILLQENDDPKLEQVLAQIAKENGGLLKKIAKKDF